MNYLKGHIIKLTTVLIAFTTFSFNTIAQSEKQEQIQAVTQSDESVEGPLEIEQEKSAMKMEQRKAF